MHLNGPAFIIPCFNNKNTFFYVERKFFDRSGWTECVSTYDTPYGEEQDIITVLPEFLQHYFTSNTDQQEIEQLAS